LSEEFSNTVNLASINSWPLAVTAKIGIAFRVESGRPSVRVGHVIQFMLERSSNFLAERQNNNCTLHEFDTKKSGSGFTTTSLSIHNGIAAVNVLNEFVKRELI